MIAGLSSHLWIYRFSAIPENKKRNCIQFTHAINPQRPLRTGILYFMPRTGKGKILVIDDDEKVLSIARRNLEAAGYEVLVASSALKMPQIVQREKPDLVLLDIEMPALSGEHVLDLATLFDFLRTTPIVLHSAKSDEELQALVARSQAKGYIKKTSNAITFVSQVEQFLAEV